MVDIDNDSHESEICQVINPKIRRVPTEVDRGRVEGCVLIVRDSTHLAVLTVDRKDLRVQPSRKCSMHKGRVIGVDI